VGRTTIPRVHESASFDLFHLRRAQASDPVHEPGADNGSQCSADGPTGAPEARVGPDHDT
jgi:hypothetical protein